MRFLCLAVLAFAACGGDKAGAIDESSDSPNGDDGNVPTVGFGTCEQDTDCRPAAATCCECPTFAVSADDPIVETCSEVTCPANPMGPQCPAAVDAVCDDGRCVLACEPMACPSTGPSGYALDASGCLTCNPTTDTDPANTEQCGRDADCVETRADCCGCAEGGADTAVLVGHQAAYDDSLDCTADEACPAVNTCEAGAAPRCVQGTCKLLAGDLPANACGRSDLPPCPSGQVCTVNLDEDATDRGLGVCAPTP